MPFHPPHPPSHCPITQEAESTRYALDTFRVRLLASGHWAVFDSQGTYLGAVDAQAEVIEVTEHLRLLASRARQQAEAERHALLHRVAETAALADLDIDL